jgi:hypothetical protein
VRFFLSLARSLAGTGFGAGIILTICEVDLAPLFGLLAFLFNFIPIVGSVIATFLPLPIVLFQPDMTLCVRKLRQHHSHTALPFLALVFSLPSNCSLSVSQVTDSPLYCLRCACPSNNSSNNAYRSIDRACRARGFSAIFIPGCVQGIVGNVIEPIVFGDKFDMHEVTVLASLTLWSVLWGVPGAVLSVPIMVIVLIILKTMKHPVAAFLVGIMRGKFNNDDDEPSGGGAHADGSDGTERGGSMRGSSSSRGSLARSSVRSDGRPAQGGDAATTSTTTTTTGGGGGGGGGGGEEGSAFATTGAGSGMRCVMLL